MDKLKIVILEDEFFAASHLKKVVKELKHIPVEIYHSGKRFLENPPLEFDMAIVDIQLADDTNGIEVAKALKKQNKPFVFLTANNEQRILLEAAKLKPSAYISKPFKSNDIAVALQIIALEMVKPLRVKTSKGYEYIEPASILFIKSEGSYIEIVTKNKTILQRRLLKEVLPELPKYFARVHRSYAANMKMVKSESSTSITIGEHKIPISRGLKINWEDYK